MSTTVEIDPGICGFPAVASVSTDDQQHVQIDIESECGSIKAINGLLKKISPIDAVADLGPNENVILKTAREFLVSKGCCEACVVPVAVCKAVQVAAGLALPKDVSMRMGSNN